MNHIKVQSNDSESHLRYDGIRMRAVDTHTRGGRASERCLLLWQGAGLKGMRSPKTAPGIANFDTDNGSEQ
jgi:hypothetical protein